MWIYTSADWDWQPHPVITIDFNRMNHKTPAELENSIQNTLDNLIASYGLAVTSTTMTMKFADIIVALSRQTEAYFHTVFYLMLSASGVDVLTEVLTSRGRMDIVVFYPDKIYIIELKCNQSAGQALEQIKQQQYADRYKTAGKRIILMGIN